MYNISLIYKKNRKIENILANKVLHIRGVLLTLKHGRKMCDILSGNSALLISFFIIITLRSTIYNTKVMCVKQSSFGRLSRRSLSLCASADSLIKLSNALRAALEMKFTCSWPHIHRLKPTPTPDEVHVFMTSYTQTKTNPNPRWSSRVHDLIYTD